MKGAFTSIGALAIVSIAACSGGAGQGSTLRGGPDGIPPSSTDSPGNGNESPGNSNQDSPGNNGQNVGGGCLTCSGSYQCAAVVSGQTSTSYITLGPAADGCAILVENSQSVDVLQCGGEFIETDNGSPALVGRWSGGDGSFVVTATVEGQAVSVTCTPGTDPNPQPQPTPQPGGGTGDTLDAG